MTTNILALINALACEETALAGPGFVAPLVRGGRARLRLRGLVCELAVADAHSGWWLCHACNTCRVEIVATALPWQRGDDLALWPELRLVLLASLDHGDWLALPFNASHAAQRFGLTGPVVVHLVEGGQPFERTVARVEGRTLWYDAPDRRADPVMAESLRAALAAERPVPAIKRLGAGEQAAFSLLADRRANKGIDGRLRSALAIGGATLVGYELIDGMLRVTWQHDGQRSVTLLIFNDSPTTTSSCGHSPPWLHPTTPLPQQIPRSLRISY